MIPSEYLTALIYHVLLKILSSDPKHPIPDKFIVTRFLEELDTFIRTPWESSGKIFEIDACAKWYAKNVTGRPDDSNVLSLLKFWKDNDIVALRFDKGTWYFVMKSHSYIQELAAVLDGSQFQKLQACN